MTLMTQAEAERRTLSQDYQRLIRCNFFAAAITLLCTNLHIATGKAFERADYDGVVPGTFYTTWANFVFTSLMLIAIGLTVLSASRTAFGFTLGKLTMAASLVAIILTVLSMGVIHLSDKLIQCNYANSRYACSIVYNLPVIVPLLASGLSLVFVFIVWCTKYRPV